jgi:hypothetical protein
MTTPRLLADNKLPTRTLCWAALLVVLGLVGFWALIGYLDTLTALQTTNPQLVTEKYSRLLVFCGLATLLIASGAGGTLGFIFYQALRTEHFPPPGTPVMWDTPPRTGSEARHVAFAGLAVAVATVLGGVGFGVVMAKIACTPVSQAITNSPFGWLFPVSRSRDKSKGTCTTEGTGWYEAIRLAQPTGREMGAGKRSCGYS